MKSEGDVRRHAAAQRRQEGAAGRRREQRHLRHDRLAAEERARTTTARSGMSGISYPGFYTACGMIDAHPALKAVARRPRSSTGSSATTATTTARSCSPHNFNFFGMLRRSRDPKLYDQKDTPRPRLRHARRLRVLPRTSARSRTPTQAPSRASSLLERDDGARRTTTTSGRPATSGRTSRTSSPPC